MTDDFRFNIPVDLIKSDTNNTDGNSEYRIGGIASTPTQDRQDDIIKPSGLNIDNFVDYGWINVDHDNTRIIGYPDKSKCKITDKGLYIEALLLKDSELAMRYWDTAVALQKSGAPRRLGFSVEGKVKKRDELGRIVKADIYNVAVTNQPVNTTCTWEAFCKSFAPDVIDEDETTTKSMDTMGGENPLIPEDLDKDEKNLENLEYKDKIINEMKKKFNNSDGDIKKSELQLYYQITRDLSSEDAETLVEVLTKNRNMEV